MTEPYFLKSKYHQSSFSSIFKWAIRFFKTSSLSSLWDPPTISPIPGKTIVIRTRDNRYAKIEIVSYYFDAPNDPNAMDNESRYYTFNYFFQSEAGNTSLY